jgi:hypothetical protein
VQNSWGTSFYTNKPPNYSNGTFWASYNDAVIGRSGVASFQLASIAPHGQTVLQNELGPMSYADDFAAVAGAPDDQTGWVGSPTGMGTVSASSVMSILTPGADTPLAALGMATQIGGVTVTASIYRWNSATESFKPLIDQVTTSNSTVGLFLAPLSQPLSLMGGQPYAVRLDYALGGSAVRGAAPVTIGGSGINGYLDVTAGLSYYLDPGTSQWIDMSSLAFAPTQGVVILLGGSFFSRVTCRRSPNLTSTASAARWRSPSRPWPCSNDTVAGQPDGPEHCRAVRPRHTPRRGHGCGPFRGDRLAEPGPAET